MIFSHVLYQLSYLGAGPRLATGSRGAPRYKDLVPACPECGTFIGVGGLGRKRNPPGDMLLFLLVGYGAVVRHGVRVTRLSHPTSFRRT